MKKKKIGGYLTLFLTLCGIIAAFFLIKPKLYNISNANYFDDQTVGIVWSDNCSNAKITDTKFLIINGLEDNQTLDDVVKCYLIEESTITSTCVNPTSSISSSYTDLVNQKNYIINYTVLVDGCAETNCNVSGRLFNQATAPFETTDIFVDSFIGGKQYLCLALRYGQYSIGSEYRISFESDFYNKKTVVVIPPTNITNATNTTVNKTTTCTPKTCLQLNKTCGSWSSGCQNKTVTCGTCNEFYTCSAIGRCDKTSECDACDVWDTCSANKCVTNTPLVFGVFTIIIVFFGILVFVVTKK